MVRYRRRPWTDEDNAKLKSIAGTKRTELIAAELRRTANAVVGQAAKLKVSLATRPRRSTPKYAEADLQHQLHLRRESGARRLAGATYARGGSERST